MAGACDYGNAGLSASLVGPCSVVLVGWLLRQHILCEKQSYILLV